MIFLKKDYLTISQMVDTAIGHYGIEPTKANKRAVRETMVRELKKDMDSWNSHTEYPKGKKPVQYYDPATVSKIIYTDLADYFKKRASAGWKLAQKYNENYYAHMEEIENYEDNATLIPYNYRQRIQDIMIRAIFEKFYNIDEESLIKDMIISENIEEGEMTGPQALAYEKIKDFQSIKENYLSEN